MSILRCTIGCIFSNSRFNGRSFYPEAVFKEKHVVWDPMSELAIPSPRPRSPDLEFLKSLWGLGTEEEEGYRTKARIFKRVWGPEIDSKE